MKKFVKASVIGASLLGMVSVTAQAATQTDLKIGVLNVQAVLLQSPQKAAVDAMMKSKFGSREQELKKLSQQIESLRGKMQSKPSSEANTQLTKLTADFQLKKQLLGQDQQQVVGDAKMKLSQLLETEVAEVAKEQKLTLVLPANTVLYAAPTLDITNKVLDKLKQSKAKIVQ